MWAKVAYNPISGYAEVESHSRMFEFLRDESMPYLQIIYMIGGTAVLLLVALIWLLVVRSRLKNDLATANGLFDLEKAGLSEKLASAGQQLESLRIDWAALQAQSDQRRDVMAEMEVQKAGLAQAATRIPVLEEALEKSRRSQEELNAVNLSLEKRLSAISTQLDAERRQAEEKLTLLDNARQRLTTEFQVLAERILEEKGRVFADHSRAQMDGLIGPLREQLGDFKKRVEDVYDKESRDRAALLNEIGHLKNLNERIGKDALNLTQALKGDVKVLGGWGEVILERIFEASGLEKGRAYETQVSLADIHGHRFQPDAVVHLPEGRDVIVDAKVSLNAYERFYASNDETTRSAALRAHLASMRAHLKGLGEKHYEDLQSLRTLDFVLMFVPIEAAFAAALEHDGSLFTEAYEKNVILVSPSTLLVTLKTIHHIWRTADQNENALEIARQAGGMYDKFIGFIEALEEVGRQLDRAKDAYRTARERLCTGRGNLIRRAEQLKILGVKANKTLPDCFAGDLEPEANGTGPRRSV